MEIVPSQHRLGHADLLQLKRWNSPTIYNGWEQITKRNPRADAFNFEETRARLNAASVQFASNAKAEFERGGEW